MRGIVLALALAIALPSGAAESAKEHYDRGTRLYLIGRYRDALKEFQEAFLAHPDPVILFNLGQCHRQLGESAQAIRAYKNYLHESPGAANRAEVERFIEELRRAEPAPATPPPQAPLPTTSTYVPPPSSYTPPPSVYLPSDPALIARENKIRSARRLRNRGTAQLVFGGIFAAAGTALTSIAIWQYDERSHHGSDTAGGHVLGPGIPGIALGLAATPMLILGTRDYVKGLHAVAEAEAAR